MMRWPMQKRRSPIGLDLGAHSFKAVQLNAAGEVLAAVALPRVEPGVPLAAAEIERLVGVMNRRGFAGRDVIIGVPGDDLLTSVLELPARAAGLPMQQLALAEFGRVHRADASALSAAAWELPHTARASKATFMLAVGAPLDKLESHADIVEAAGLDVVAIDDPYSACVRGCLHRGRNAGTAPAGLRAIVDIGWTCSTLAIVRGDVIVYTRDLTDSGLAEIFKEADEIFGVRADDVRYTIWTHGFAASVAAAPAAGAANAEADADVLAILAANVGRMLKEIDQALAYAAHQYPDDLMTRLTLAGGGALLPGIAERFGNTLALPIDLAPGLPPAGATFNATADQVTALGLALMPGVAK